MTLSMSITLCRLQSINCLSITSEPKPKMSKTWGWCADNLHAEGLDCYWWEIPPSLMVAASCRLFSLFTLSKKKTLKWKETMMINCLLCFYSIFVAGLLKLFMTKSRANSVRMRNHRSYEVSLISRRTNGAKIIRSPKFYFNLGAVFIVDR